MRVTLTTPIRDLKGELIRDGERTLTLRDVLGVTLLGEFPDERDSGEQKFKRYRLACRIADAEEAELSAEEVALLKARVAKAYPALIVGRTWELLDPTEEK